MASFETQRMILAQLIDRVTVKRSYEIELWFEITVNKFSGADAKAYNKKGGKPIII